MHASGHRILFVDADGASHFPDLALLEDEMDRLEAEQDTVTSDEKEWVGGHGVIVGSRAHLVRTELVVKVWLKPILTIRTPRAHTFTLIALLLAKSVNEAIPYLPFCTRDPDNPRHSMRVSLLLV